MTAFSQASEALGRYALPMASLQAAFILPSLMTSRLIILFRRPHAVFLCAGVKRRRLRQRGHGGGEEGDCCDDVFHGAYIMYRRRLVQIIWTLLIKALTVLFNGGKRCDNESGLAR